MRSRIGRKLRQNSSSVMGATDWGSIFDAVAQAAPAVISAVKPKPTTTTSGGSTSTTIYQQPKQSKTNYIPWIAGGLGLATLGYFALNKSSKRK